MQPQANCDDAFTLRELFFSEKVLGPMQRFLRLEVSSSALLLLAAILALAWANSGLAHTYHQFWHHDFELCFGGSCFSMPLLEWVNGGLMAFFFFVVGLEIKREFLVGELSSLKMAMLPAIAAVGGMVLPGLIYTILNFGTPQMSGWAIPMATDVAFALGALAVLGRGLPPGLRIFLAAFAIADDIGGVLIIAIFYTGQLSVSYLLLSAAILLLIGLFNFLRFRSMLLYALLCFVLWVTVLNSGVHPTIAGVAAAMMMPARGKFDFEYFMKKVSAILGQTDDSKLDVCNWYTILLDRDYLNTVYNIRMACQNVETPLQRFEYALHPWVAFLILPIFALGNAGVTVAGTSLSEAFLNPVSLGISLGLFLGKPLGVGIFGYMAVRSGLASLPEGVRWPELLGVGLLGGIGFTVSLFISSLSFQATELLNFAKLGVLTGSALSAIGGALILAYVTRGKRSEAACALSEAE